MRWVLIAVMAAAPAAAVEFESGARRVLLLELFTSEGCSSCPPADRWLAALKDDRRLWKDFVPVGFHVTYWDYIGWPDPFASQAYTRRQHAYAQAWGTRRVYTPGYVVGGDEASRRRPKSKERAGRLRARVLDDGRLVVEYWPTQEADASWTAHAALLGFGLTSKVRAGENRGRTLRHEFTALGLGQGKMRRRGPRWVRTLPLPKPATRAPRYGLAVWVSRGAEVRPAQSTGGMLPKSARKMIESSGE